MLNLILKTRLGNNLSLPRRSSLPLPLSLSLSLSQPKKLILSFPLPWLGFLARACPSLPSSAAMKQAVVDGLLNLRLMKEEEEEILITTRSKSELLEECTLSLFG